MSISTVLFDLDGTLLPMDMDLFTNGYFKFLVKKAAPFGYEPENLIKTIWAGVKAMVENDGSVSNEEAFWNKFTEIYGKESIKDKHIFDEFYANEFKKAEIFCGYNEKARLTVNKIKEKGLRVCLATNPIFPEVATKIRAGWAGFELDDFELYTTYENINSCKPNIKYYEEVARRLKVSPEECLMVGNDVIEDMAAGKIGMKVFLLTDCVINKENRDISVYPHGSFDELMDYINSL